jgi:hypothetical protein
MELGQDEPCAKKLICLQIKLRLVIGGFAEKVLPYQRCFIMNRFIALQEPSRTKYRAN